MFDQILKGHPEPQLLDLPAIVLDSLGQIVAYAMPVKAHADLHARAAHDVLLLGGRKEIQHILMLSVIVRGIVADVHFPENTAFGHFLEEIVRVIADLFGKAKKVGVCHACFAAAPLGKAEQVALGNRLIDGVNILNQTIIKAGKINRALKKARFFRYKLKI